MRPLSCKFGLHYNRHDNATGAQTERRGGAGPVRGLLGGKDPTGRRLSTCPLAYQFVYFGACFCAGFAGVFTFNNFSASAR